MKGLRIVGSRQLLESCGFTSEIKTFYAETSDDELFDDEIFDDETSSREYFYVEISENS